MQILRTEHWLVPVPTDRANIHSTPHTRDSPDPSSRTWTERVRHLLLRHHHQLFIVRYSMLFHLTCARAFSSVRQTQFHGDNVFRMLTVRAQHRVPMPSKGSHMPLTHGMNASEASLRVCSCHAVTWPFTWGECSWCRCASLSNASSAKNLLLHTTTSRVLSSGREQVKAEMDCEISRGTIAVLWYPISRVHS